MFLSPNLCTSRQRLIRWNFSLSWRFQPRKSFYQFSRAFDVDGPRRPWIYARPKMAKCSIILSHVPPIINSNLPISESLIFISQKWKNCKTFTVLETIRSRNITVEFSLRLMLRCPSQVQHLKCEIGRELALMSVKVIAIGPSTRPVYWPNFLVIA